MRTRASASLLVLFYFFSFASQSQSIVKKIKEIKSTEITQVAVDRLGNFFICSKNKPVKKINPSGKVTASLKARNITLLEPWYHPAIFCYDRKKNSISTYGRNFENEKTTAIDPAWAISPILVCPSNDNKIWLFDQADASIKKVNPLSSEVVIEFSLDTTQFKTAPFFTHLREYQNLIFLLDQNSGILIFNTIGKQINKIKKPRILNFNFFGEELYFLDGAVVKFIDLRSEEIHELKVGDDNRFVLVTDERLILINRKNIISLFEIAW